MLKNLSQLVFTRPLGRLWPLIGLVAIGLLLWLLASRFIAVTPLNQGFSFSREVLASNGQLLRLSLAPDQQYRLWLPLAQIAPSMIDALLLKEDRDFYQHGGVSFLALIRSAYRTYSGGQRQGGSTLSMQLARRLYRINSRQLSGKVQQILAAWWLEARYSKTELLEAYLNLAPMGSNIEGVAAASRIYFNKSADQLSLNDALTLAVLPQQPSQRGRFGPQLQRARLQLVQQWRQQHPTDPRNASLLDLPVTAKQRHDLPRLAPHFSEQLLRMNPEPQIHSTLDLDLQQLSERLVQQFIAERQTQGIRNASLILVDSRDQSVKALVGSADHQSPEIQGQINGSLARRSPGSTLKPFIYGLALDQGLIHPLSLLKDSPSAFGAFQPENFDGRFVGPISAQDALIRSRNVPAVWLASQLHPNLYWLLQQAGVQQLQPENHYGLSLALGGGELQMTELAQLYLLLATDGRLRSLRYWQHQPSSLGPALLSTQASFIVRDMLRHNTRPDGLPNDSRGQNLPIAWKTGTSWGFHDSWSAGLIGPYVLIVWVGNFDGKANPAFVGIKTAAPLFFRLADALNLRPESHRFSESVPTGLRQVEVCRASGELPNLWCPNRTHTWFIPGVSPISVSQLHQAVWLNNHTGQIACPPYDANRMHQEVFEFWPSDLQQLFSAAGLARRSLPATEPGCQFEANNLQQLGPEILSPLNQVSYQLQLSRPNDEIKLQASVNADSPQVYWFADASLIGASNSQTELGWRPQRAGSYLLRAVDQQGRSSSRQVKVEFLK